MRLNKHTQRNLPYRGVPRPIKRTQAAIRKENGKNKAIDEGVEKLDKIYRERQRIQHTFIPMGRLNSCEYCGASEAAVMFDGRKVHTDDSIDF